jgi:hypothetical protein
MANHWLGMGGPIADSPFLSVSAIEGSGPDRSSRKTRLHCPEPEASSAVIMAPYNSHSRPPATGRWGIEWHSSFF